jgi:hypothetical protein
MEVEDGINLTPDFSLSMHLEAQMSRHFAFLIPKS